MNILFGPVRTYPDIRLRFDTLSKDQRIDVPSNTAFGLERLTIAPEALRPGQRPSETYVQRDGEDFVFIVCGLPRPERSPACKAEFLADGHLISVSYSRLFLPQWRDINKSTRRLIASLMR